MSIGKFSLKLSRLLFFVGVAAFSIPALAAKPLARSSAQAQADNDDGFGTLKTPGPSAEAVKSLLRKIATDKANCEKNHCSNVRLLRQFEETLRAYQDLLGHDKFVVNENNTFRSEIKSLSLATAVREPASAAQGCYKKDLIRNLLVDYGISENGDGVFSKKPMQQENSRCWTNSRKRVGGTVTLCEFPLAINIQTIGGDSSSTTARTREYIFALNGCDLVTTHIRDEGQSGKPRETHLSYSMCLEQWNKRTADATMSAQQAMLMEDTIGFCFRERLLPPRNSFGGRSNPLINFDRTLSSTPTQK